MPPRGVKSAKRERQYEHIKTSAKKRGKSTDRAEEIAARTVNKQRREAGETRGAKGAKKGSAKGAKKRSAKSATKGTAKGARKGGATRKSSAKRTTKKSSKKR